MGQPSFDSALLRTSLKAVLCSEGHSSRCPRVTLPRPPRPALRPLALTDITLPAHAALAAGCEGITAINTITSVMGINLDTLRPEPCGGSSASCMRVGLREQHQCRVERVKHGQDRMGETAGTGEHSLALAARICSSPTCLNRPLLLAHPQSRATPRPAATQARR